MNPNREPAHERRRKAASEPFLSLRADYCTSHGGEADERFCGLCMPLHSIEGIK